MPVRIKHEERVKYVDVSVTVEALMQTAEQGYSPLTLATGAKTSEGHGTVAGVGINTIAKGRMTDEGFVILAGSIAPGDVTGSFPDTKKAHRQKLIDKGVIELRGDELVFLENVLMGTPSGASTLIVGSPSNGWVDWKTQDGKTLDAATKEAKASE